jgi:hypothetical protein
LTASVFVRVRRQLRSGTSQSKRLTLRYSRTYGTLTRSSMENDPTCGKGLAEHSALPATLADLVAALADNLERHLATLDRTDENARREYDAYQRLSREHRALADQLRATAAHMASYRDLPMGRHDETALSDPALVEAFRKFVAAEQAVHELLGKSLERDRAMLARTRG